MRPDAAAPGPRRGTRSRSLPGPGFRRSGTGRTGGRPRHPALPAQHPRRGRPHVSVLAPSYGPPRCSPGYPARGPRGAMLFRRASGKPSSRFHSGSSAGSTACSSSSRRRLDAGGQTIVVGGQSVGQPIFRAVSRLCPAAHGTSTSCSAELPLASLAGSPGSRPCAPHRPCSPSAGRSRPTRAAPGAARPRPADNARAIVSAPVPARESTRFGPRGCSGRATGLAERPRSRA